LYAQNTWYTPQGSTSKVYLDNAETLPIASVIGFGCLTPCVWSYWKENWGIGQFTPQTSSGVNIDGYAWSSGSGGWSGNSLRVRWTGYSQGGSLNLW
jgi:hypothetical protein